MKKAKSIMIALLSVMVAGCSNINNEQQEDNGIATEQQTEEENQSIQSTDTAKENETSVATDNIVDYYEHFQGISGIQDSITYDEYSGYWSYEGKTQEQVLAEGGIELSCTITGDNQFSGTLFAQQEITQRFASIENISGKIEQAELYFDYSDDEWGNSGTLHIQFLSDSIYVEVLNYKKAENGSDYGISGSFELSSPVLASLNAFSAASGDFAKAAAIFLSLIPTNQQKKQQIFFRLTACMCRCDGAAVI